jgi:hypothetical protein
MEGRREMHETHILQEYMKISSNLKKGFMSSRCSILIYNVLFLMCETFSLTIFCIPHSCVFHVLCTVFFFLGQWTFGLFSILVQKIVSNSLACLSCSGFAC